MIERNGSRHVVINDFFSEGFEFLFPVKIYTIQNNLNQEQKNQLWLFQTDYSVGRDLQTDNSVGRDLQTDYSVGRDFQTDYSVGRDFQTNYSVGRDFQTDYLVGSDFQIDYSAGSDFQIYYSVGSDFQTDYSVGRDFQTDYSAGRTSRQIIQQVRRLFLKDYVFLKSLAANMQGIGQKVQY